MITLRKAQERGHANHGWLDTYHTFSFADYHDSRFMNFRALRVINEDWVSPGQGFGTHGHRDMEIITYILEGELEHKDSLGNGSVIHAGEVQYMSAGTGVTHSEFNPSKKEPVHLLQIWIVPREKSIKPGYQEKSFTGKDRQNQLLLLASASGEKGSAIIHQDVYLWTALLDKRQNLNHVLGRGRHAWIQVISGQLNANGLDLQSGDGAAVSNEKQIELSTNSSADFLLFDLV